MRANDRGCPCAGKPDGRCTVMVDMLDDALVAFLRVNVVIRRELGVRIPRRDTLDDLLGCDDSLSNDERLHDAPVEHAARTHDE